MHGRANWWTEGGWGSESLSLSLSINLSVCLSACLPVCLSPAFRLVACLPGWLAGCLCLSVCLSVCLPACLAGWLAVCLSVCLAVCLSLYLSVSLCIYLFIRLSVYLTIYYLPTFLPIWKQLCETLRDSARLPSKLPSQMEKWSAELAASPVPVRFAIFSHSMCLKHCACHKKVKPSHTTCCTSHTKSPQQTWRSDAPKRTPPQEISALTPPTCLTETCLVVLRLPRKMHLSRSSNVPRLPSFLKLLQTRTFCSLLVKCRIPCACHRKWRLNVQKSIVRSFWTAQLPEAVRPRDVFSILALWLRHALRATKRALLSISTSKSAPILQCFEMFSTCSLPNIPNARRATLPRAWRTSQVPKVFRTGCALHVLNMHFAPHWRALFEHLNF